MKHLADPGIGHQGFDGVQVAQFERIDDIGGLRRRHLQQADFFLEVKHGIRFEVHRDPARAGEFLGRLLQCVAGGDQAVSVRRHVFHYFA